MTRARSLLLLICLLARPSLALNPVRQLTQYGYAHWDTGRGLPQNSVRTILQARDGYLWMGTDEGLARFDGVRFTVYDSRNTPALGSRIFKIVEDRAGNLWIASANGIARRDPSGAFRRYGSAEGLPETAVRVAMLDVDGSSVWFGANEGLFKIAPGDRVTRYSMPTSGEAWVPTFVAQDPSGKIWGISRTHEYFRFDGQLFEELNDVRLPQRGLNQLLAARDGALWIATEDAGLVRYSAEGVRTFTTADGLPTNRIRSIFEDSKGVLWVGLDGKGITRLIDGRFRPVTGREAWASDEVLAFYEDREGSVWVGTFVSGVHQLTDGKLYAIGKDEGLADDTVWSVLQDRAGDVWVGSSQGLSRVRGGQVIWKSDSLGGRPLGNAWALDEASDGSLWVGSRSGVFHLQGEKVEFFDPAPALGTTVVQAVYEDVRGDVWLGTPAGIGRLRGGVIENVTREFKLPPGSSVQIAEDPSGTLWIGLRGGGLLRFEGGRFTALTAADGLANDWIHDLHWDADGVLWVATAAGLSRVEKGRIFNFHVAHGLFDENIHRLLEDGQGNFWMSSNRGIFKLSRAGLSRVARGELARVEPEVFGAADGMRTSECNGSAQPAGWKLRDGQLWFACLRGAVVIDPEHLRYNPVPPELNIEQLTHDGVVAAGVRGGGALSVPPGTRTLELTYAALSFVNPKQVRLRHRLEGYDREWVEAGSRRVAYYTNLPPGDYAFQVLASNDDGVWATTPVTLRFTLLPYFHQTWAFIALCVLAGVGAVTGAWRVRVRYLKRQEAQLRLHNAQLEHALAAAQEAVRLKGEFVANTSHELRTPLNAIINIPEGLLEHFDPISTAVCGGCAAVFELEPGEELDGRPCPDCGGALSPKLDWRCRENAAEVVQGLRWLRQSGTHLLRVVNDVLDFSKLEAGKMTLVTTPVGVAALIEELQETLQPLAREKEIRLDFERVPDGVTVCADAVKCSQIFINLVSNALKFSPKGSAIELRVARTPNELTFSVRDHGEGIAPEHQSAVFESFRQIDGGQTRRQGGTGLGLSITRKLVELHGGKIWLESVVGEGTTFFVTLPAEPPAVASQVQPEVTQIPNLSTSKNEQERGAR